MNGAPILEFYSHQKPEGYEIRVVFWNANNERIEQVVRYPRRRTARRRMRHILRAFGVESPV